MTQATVTALNARLDYVASELDRMRHSRHRQQWPEGHSEDPGFQPRSGFPQRGGDAATTPQRTTGKQSQG